MSSPNITARKTSPEMPSAVPAFQTCLRSHLSAQNIHFGRVQKRDAVYLFSLLRYSADIQHVTNNRKNNLCFYTLWGGKKTKTLSRSRAECCQRERERQKERFPIMKTCVFYYSLSSFHFHFITSFHKHHEFPTIV